MDKEDEIDDIQIDNIIYYLFKLSKKKILTFAIAGMKLEDILLCEIIQKEGMKLEDVMLSEISQKGKEKNCMISFITWNKK